MFHFWNSVLFFVCFALSIFFSSLNLVFFTFFFFFFFFFFSFLLTNRGVTPILPLRRRFYPGDNSGGRNTFIKVKFPQEVTSLPYNTRFMTEEGVQYFRVIHDNQVKTCRICASVEHERKDCPHFTCRGLS